MITFCPNVNQHAIRSNHNLFVNIIPYQLRYKFLFLLVFVFCLFNTSVQVKAAPGDLDTSFGNGGKVITDLGAGDLSRTILVQPDGKILALGQKSQNVEITFITLTRYNSNGSLDTTFGSNGTTSLHVGFSTFPSGMILQPDGKIVVAYTVQHSLFLLSMRDFGVARFESNGSFDSSFGSGGTVLTDFAGEEDLPRSVALQPDGKIVVVGGVKISNVSKFGMARYNTNGSMDTSFDSDGLATPDTGSGGFLTKIVVQPDGKILVGGRAGSTNADFMLARYNADGSPDNTFGTNGRVNTDFAGLEDMALDLRLLANGKIIACGYATTNLAQDLALARYNSDGTLDTSFGTNGKVTTDFFGGNDNAASMAIQSNGKIILAGVATNNGNQDFAIARYNSNGSLDPSFSQDGKQTTAFLDTESASSVALQPDGKIVALGYTWSSAIGDNLALARYFAAPSVICDFDGDAKTDVSVFRPNGGIWYSLNSSNNSFNGRPWGGATDKLTPADFDGDGKTDLGVFHPENGNWLIINSNNNSVRVEQFGVSEDIPRPADYDGDTKADIAVFRPSTGTWYIQRSTQGFMAVNFGAQNDIPLVGDYDGDGKADIGIYRPTGGSGNAEWWLLRSTAGLFAAPFGSATDKPVPGDYTGDRKTDVAFFRPSTGEWFVLRSEDLSYYAAPFGASEDIPVPGDYDADGIMDWAVWRPSNGVWYLQGSTAGFQVIQFGANGDKPLPDVYNH